MSPFMQNLHVFPREKSDVIIRLRFLLRLGWVKRPSFTHVKIRLKKDFFICAGFFEK